MSDCCSTRGEGSPLHLVVIGGGSAAFAAAIRANELGARIPTVQNLHGDQLEEDLTLGLGVRVTF